MVQLFKRSNPACFFFGGGGGARGEEGKLPDF